MAFEAQVLQNVIVMKNIKKIAFFKIWNAYPSKATTLVISFWNSVVEKSASTKMNVDWLGVLSLMLFFSKVSYIWRRL